MRLRRTLAVGVLSLAVAGVATGLVVRDVRSSSAASGALVEAPIARATGTEAVAGAAPAATPGGEGSSPLDGARAVVETSTPTPADSRSPTPAPSPVERGTGRLSWVDWGEVPDARPSGGTVVRVALELEGGLGLDPARTASQIASILVDDRGWQVERDIRFVFVTPEQARRGEFDTRIAIASKLTTMDLCGPVKTEGFTSCYNGRVVINLDRWVLGVDAYAGRLDDYRTYVVDHEVGHSFGLGHSACPAEGAPAPVMVPQTLHLWGCSPNPYPVLG